MKRVFSLVLSIVMVLSVTAGIDLTAYAECAHEHIIIINQRPATEEETGYTGDTQCEDCGEIIEEGEEIPILISGWKELDGKRYYYGEDGKPYIYHHMIDGKWYYFDGSGAMKTGWKKTNGKWYFYGADGAMVTGWQYADKKWYLFDENGVMLTGWQKTDNKWYYLDGSGAMVSGWKKIGGKWYCFNKSGVMLTGWQKIGNKWYYFANSGAMLTGWQKIGNKWYYMYSSGAMATGWTYVNKAWYYMSGSGAMLTGWQKIGNKWYYFNKGGSMAKGWKKIDEKWYHFNESSGVMETGYVNVYSTYSSNYVNNPNRTTNLIIASSYIDGTILAPGETFSFNAVVGPRTVARGYREAPVFTGPTGHENGLAGGICQVSSTVFNAALLANMQILERHQHSQRVYYVPFGRDAAISGSAQNMRFKNTTPYTIKIEMTVKGGVITCTMYTVEHVSPPKVTLNVSQSGKTFTLTRYVNGSSNYTTKSTY